MTNDITAVNQQKVAEYREELFDRFKESYEISKQSENASHDRLVREYEETLEKMNEAETLPIRSQVLWDTLFGDFEYSFEELETFESFVINSKTIPEVIEWFDRPYNEEDDIFPFMKE